MATMSFGYHFDQGVRVGFDISVKNVSDFGGLYLSNVSSKDKGRIVREIIHRTGVKKQEIIIQRVEL